jgi:hypothetical protein
MATITPGYDFGATEIPTRDKLLKQATGLQISGIPDENLANTLTREIISNTTAASNLPGEGALWCDGRGNLWGCTRWGNVQLRRYGGGSTTRRFEVPPGSITSIVRPGNLQSLGASNVNDSTFSGALVYVNCAAPTSGMDPCFTNDETLVSQDTGTGRHFMMRTSGFGRACLYNDLTTQSHTRYRARNNAGAVNAAFIQSLWFDHQYDTIGEGNCYGADEVSTKTEANLYFFGGLVRLIQL